MPYIVDQHIVDPYTDGPDQDMYYGSISYTDPNRRDSHLHKIEVRDMEIAKVEILLQQIADALNQQEKQTNPTTKDPYDHAMGVI